jgi:hypothetical protein
MCSKTVSCRPIANDARQTARCRAACCRDVTLSLGSNRRIGYLYIYVYKPIDRATSIQLATRERAIWRVSLVTRRKGDNDIGCLVAMDNAKRKVSIKIQVHNKFKYISLTLQNLFYISCFAVKHFYLQLFTLSTT